MVAMKASMSVEIEKVLDETYAKRDEIDIAILQAEKVGLPKRGTVSKDSWWKMADMRMSKIMDLHKERLATRRRIKGLEDALRIVR